MFLTPQPLSRRRSFSILPRRGSAKERRLALPSPELLRRRSVRERSIRQRENPPSPPLQKPKEKLKSAEKPAVVKQDNGTISILAEQVIPSKINILLTKPSVQSSSIEKFPPDPSFSSPPSPPPCAPQSPADTTETAQRRRAAFRQVADSTVIHALVHRESEEYSLDEQGS